MWLILIRLSRRREANMIFKGGGVWLGLFDASLLSINYITKKRKIKLVYKIEKPY